MTKRPGPVEQLAALRERAEYKRKAEDGYRRFIDGMRTFGGWSEEDVADYRSRVRILMGKDDAATLALYEPGVYATAQEARDAAMEFWVCWK